MHRAFNSARPHTKLEAARIMNYQALLQSIVVVHRESLGTVAAAVNRSLVVRNWLVGAYLVEFEQEGEERAAYGDRLLERVSSDLRGNKSRRGVGRRRIHRWLERRSVERPRNPWRRTKVK
jgi:hypothetical protein